MRCPICKRKLLVERDTGFTIHQLPTEGSFRINKETGCPEKIREHEFLRPARWTDRVDEPGIWIVYGQTSSKLIYVESKPTPEQQAELCGKQERAYGPIPKPMFVKVKGQQ